MKSNSDGHPPLTRAPTSALLRPSSELVKIDRLAKLINCSAPPTRACGLGK